MKSIAKVLDISGALETLFPKRKDLSLNTIYLGRILIVNHPNIACELTIYSLIEGYIFIMEHHRMIDCLQSAMKKYLKNVLFGPRD